MKSADFRRLWARHDVRDKTHGTKCLRHPIVGELTLSWETLALRDDSDQTLITYTAEPGSKSETGLRLLGSMTEPARGAERRPAVDAT
jgi:MmyB-like transcription regulator ligand binding domain